MEVQYKNMGPAGGTGNPASPPPQSFTALPPPLDGPWRISRITGRNGNQAGGAINQISVVWESANGATVATRPFGGQPFEGDGATSFDITIAKDDYLNFLKVFTGNVQFPPQGGLTFDVVTGLIFRTQNQNNPDIVGNETSQEVAFECPAGNQIVGFFGLQGGLIDSLGAYIQAIPQS